MLPVRMRPLPRRGTDDMQVPTFLASQAHAYTRAELIGAWSRHHLDVALRSGRAVRLLPGVYIAPDHRRCPVVMGEAATLWAPRAVVTGALALHLYSDSLRAPQVVDLVTANGDTLHPPEWIRVHQSGRPTQQGFPAGIPCATPERALLDAWRFASPGERRGLLYEALWARICTWRALVREMKRAPRVADRRELERILGWFAEGATSPLEVRAKHETFADARFREFEWQAKLRLGSRRVTVDMLHREAMVVVELDGDRYHSTREARRDDRERQNALAAAGFVTMRFGWDDVVLRPEWCRERVLAVIAGRLERPGSR